MVFNLCNDIRGDSKLAQLPVILEFADIPYTGSSVLGHTLAINKIYSSNIFKTYDIPTPNFISVYSTDDLQDLGMKFPILIKPNDEGSSRGIHQDSLVFDMDTLIKKVDDELKIYNPPIMLNEYIEGREFPVGVIGNDRDIIVLPIQEVDLSNLPDNLMKFYSFEIKAYKALMLKDYARVDIILEDNTPYVLEVNSLPGLMKGKSSLYRMVETIDLGYENLVLKIVETAIKRYNFK